MVELSQEEAWVVPNHPPLSPMEANRLLLLLLLLLPLLFRWKFNPLPFQLLLQSWRDSPVSSPKTPGKISTLRTPHEESYLCFVTPGELKKQTPGHYPGGLVWVPRQAFRIFVQMPTPSPGVDGCFWGQRAPSNWWALTSLGYGRPGNRLVD